MKTENVYYIASVKSLQVKSIRGNIITKENETLWLAEGRDGYPSLMTTKSWAKRFDKPPTASVLSIYDGMPWYHRIKPNTLEVFKVVHKVTHLEVKEEVKIDE